MKRKPAVSLPSFLLNSLPILAAMTLGVSPICAELPRDKAIDVAIAQRDWPTAAELAARWHAEEPDRVEPLGFLALARIRQTDFGRGRKALEQWETKLTEPDPAALELRGDLAFHEKDYLKAVQHWTDSYRLKPSFQLAEKLIQDELWTEEDEASQKDWFLALAKRYQIPDLQWEATKISMEKRDWDALAKYIELNRPTNNYETRKLIHDITQITESRDELVALDQEMDSSPSFDAATKRAALLRNLKLYRLALGDALFAQEQVPKAMAPRILLAQIYSQLDMPEAARELKVVVEESHKLDKLAEADQSISKETFAERAHILLQIGQPYLALEDLEQAEVTPFSLTTKGQALRQIGRLDEASASFRRVLQSEPQNYEALSAQALMAMDKADYQSAIPYLEKIVKIYPASDYYQKRLEICQSRLR